MKKPVAPKPTSVDLGLTAIQYTVVTTLEKKYPGHDFVVFGKKLYVDDKDIPFQYSDEAMDALPAILPVIEAKVAKLI